MRMFSFPSHKSLIASEPVVARYSDTCNGFLTQFAEHTIAMHEWSTITFIIEKGTLSFWTAGISPCVSKACSLMSSVTSGTQNVDCNHRNLNKIPAGRKF
jgi:hypothetical protein